MEIVKWRYFKIVISFCEFDIVPSRESGIESNFKYLLKLST